MTADPIGKEESSPGVARAMLVFIAFLLAAGCATTAKVTNVPQLSASAAEVPVYHFADRWIFRVIREAEAPREFSLLSPARPQPIGNRGFVQDTDDREADLFDDALWVTVYRDDSAIRALDFPLTPGKKWTYSYASSGERSARKAEITVIGSVTEPIRTPAGVFPAIEIHRVETWRNAERTTVYFYSPQTKSVVKSEANAIGLDGDRHYEMELISYSVME